MPETQELKKVVEDITSIYQTKIEDMASLFETTQLILNEFQEPLLKTKQVGEEINSQLKDLLSQNEYLRKKDFDRMMQGIPFAQVEKAKEIRNLVNNYLTEQKEMINLLKEHLTKTKDAIAKGEAVKPQESLKHTLAQILIQQNKRKQEVTSKLKEFQKEQREMTERLLELLAKGKELRIKDLKLMLKKFQASHRERLARCEEGKIEMQKRKDEVRNMLIEFKKKRIEFAKSRHSKSSKDTPPVTSITS
jgi:hypothetical protein